MRKVFLLARTLLKSGGLFGGGKTGKRGKWLVPIMLGFAFISFAFSIGMMAIGMYDALSQVGQESVLLPLAFGATSAVIFLFGIFYVVSVMYHADDVPMLLYMPFRPWEILGGKFITLVMYEYIFEAFILLPVLGAYVIKAAVGVPFILYAVVLILATPVIALSLAAVIIMVVMRFTRFAKNKQAFNYVSSILALVVAVGFNIFLQSNIEKMMSNPGAVTSLVPVMKNMFPGVGFAADALIYSSAWAGLLNLLLFLLCSGAAVAVFLLLGQVLYFKGVTGVTETSAKRKAISAEALTRETAGAPVLWTYTKKELRLLVRSPIAFMNCVLMNFIWPVLLLVVLFARGQSAMIAGVFATMDGGAILAIIVGTSAFISAGNAVTSSAISREGKSMYFMKYIPVSMKRQLSAKVLAGLLLSIIGIVILSGIVIYLAPDKFIFVLIGLVLSVPAALASSVAGLLIDASRPKLDWTNEQQAIKQNMNVLLHMLFGVVWGLAIVLPVVLIPMSPWIAPAYIAVLAALLCLFLVRAMGKSAQRIVEMDA